MSADNAKSKKLGETRLSYTSGSENFHGNPFRELKIQYPEITDQNENAMDENSGW